MSTPSITAAPTPSSTGRPPAVRWTIGLLVFLGVSGLFGGIGLVFGIWGMQLIPREPLDRIPLIDTWLVPGLVLSIGFGLGSLATAYGVLLRPERPRLALLRRRTGRHWSWTATILLGLGQLTWLLVEWAYIGVSPLLVLYGVVGVALVVLPLLTSARRHLTTADGTAFDRAVSRVMD